jgi:hypothetical protein
MVCRRYRPRATKFNDERGEFRKLQTTILGGHQLAASQRMSRTWAMNR